MPPITPPPTVPASADRRGPARIAGVAAMVLVALFAFRLAGLYDATRRAARSEAQLAAELEGLSTEIAGLETQQAVAATDAYVERWAREERGWVREGDQPFAVAVVTALPSPTATATPAPPGVIDRLRHWLRGETSP